MPFAFDYPDDEEVAPECVSIDIPECLPAAGQPQIDIEWMEEEPA